ncbi:MAG: nitroreductase family deazaflavin-dependent oxidoreductase [Planctomycetota bacterium]|jgi:deazaflavin-dependent oxidoreductase (nitroreductase family)
MSESFIVRLTTNPVATWIIRNVVSHVDPWLFKATNGRLTCFGPPAMPMVTLTTVGRRSGKPRAVHLACIEHAGEAHVVASAMGQEKHPAWRYNLEAHPEIEVQAQGESYRAEALVLSDVEKKEIWERIKQVIPQMNVYEQRTDRNIRVFRLRRIQELS